MGAGGAVFQLWSAAAAGCSTTTWTLISSVRTGASLLEGFGAREAKAKGMNTIAQLWRERLRYFGVIPYPPERRRARARKRRGRQTPPFLGVCGCLGPGSPPGGAPTAP